MVGDADVSVVADARQPPPDSLLRELDRRGLRKPTGTPPPRSVDPPTRSQAEQLAELQRRFPDDFKSAKNGEASA